jgi:membrane dipeptidase
MLRVYPKIVFILYLIACVFQYSIAQPDRIMKIHHRACIIDTHTDTPMKLVSSQFNLAERHQAPESQVDFPRLKEGDVDAVFFALFTEQLERVSANYQHAYELANKMVDSIIIAVTRNSGTVGIATSSNEIKHLSKENKTAICIGMENGFPLAKDISRVKEFYDRGVRYITLCHSFNNDICDSSTDPKGSEHNGLSKYGREVVAEMNRLGMIIDVSHVSDKSFFDIVAFSKAPVIASHSSVRSLCDHPRNMSDDMIRALAKNGGVIQISIVGMYLSKTDSSAENHGKRADIKKLVDHIDYVAKLAGVNYVGIGSDFDGGGGLIDCKDVTDFPEITAELVKRGYSRKEIAKIWGENFLRVFKDVENRSKS